MDYKSIILSTEVHDLEFEKGGKDFSISVKIQNGSGVGLYSYQNVFLTYHILDIDNNMLRWDNKRTEIEILPGEEKYVDVVGILPSEAGEYYFHIDMVKEGVEWYSVQGMEGIVIHVKILEKGSKYRDIMEEEIRRQGEIEKEFSNILSSGRYTLETPYIKLNPYDNSPLTAVTIFQTEEPMSISVTVVGKTKEADVVGNFSEYTTEHIVPVYGLYADFLNTVILIGQTENEKRKEKILQIQTTPLEGDFNAVNLCTYIGDASRYEPGVNFCYTGLENKGIKMAYDINGDIRWYFSQIFTEQTLYVSSASIWLIKQYDVFPNELLEGMMYEYSLLGRIMSIMIIAFRIHHDILLTKRDTFDILIDSDDTLHDAAIEVDRRTGEVLHYFNYKKMFMRTRNVSELYTDTDWLHMNAIVEHNGDIIVSGNTQSTIMKHDKQGNIKWILADPIGYTTYWKSLVLTPIGDNFEYCYNQHAIEILPDMDGNPDTFDMLLFDNGNSRNKCNGLDKQENPLYSRIVQYRINEKDRTVEQIWEYGKERKELYSMWRGDANLHTNGNVLGVFNLRDKNSIDGKNYTESCVCVEVDRDKNVVWESYGCSDKVRNSYQNYRMVRKEMYDAEETNINLSHEVRVVEVRRKD